MKVGILTYHTSYNYGAFLQAYALCEEVNKIDGIHAEIIDFTMASAKRMNYSNAFSHKKQPLVLALDLKRFYLFKKSVNRFLNLSDNQLISDDLDEANRFIAAQSYDTVIAGSDEIWKVDGFRGFPTAYWLTDKNATYKKIAYATSSRTALTKITSHQKESISSYLDGFEYIGVRDYPTKQLIEKCISDNKEVHINCDPTFFHVFSENVEKGKAILKNKYRIHSGKKCIALMCESAKLAQTILENYGNQYQFISLYQYYNGANYSYIPDPFEWIDVIAACDGLITTYFHGTVFALKTNTPFISFEMRDIDDPKESKIFDLLARNQLSDHFYLLNDPKLNVIEALTSFLQVIENRNSVIDFSAVCKKEIGLSRSFFEVLKKHE